MTYDLLSAALLLINAALAAKNHLINAASAAPLRRISKKKFSTPKGLPLLFFHPKIATVYILGN